MPKCNLDCEHCTLDVCVEEDCYDIELTKEEFCYFDQVEQSLHIDIDRAESLVDTLVTESIKSGSTVPYHKLYELARVYDHKRREQKRQQYLRHREEKLSYMNTYYNNNREECVSRSHKYYENNRDEINARRRANRRAQGIMPKTKLTDEELRARQREQQRIYREKNRERLNEYKRKKYHESKELLKSQNQLEI